MRHVLLLALIAQLLVLATGPARLLSARVVPGGPAASGELFVDPVRGKDGAPGTERKPLRSISAALASLAEPLAESVTIHLAGGTYGTTGGVGMPERSLALMLRMRPGVTVSLVGSESEPVVLGWDGDRRMIEATEGTWRLARLRVGNFSKEQRRGVQVAGPAHVILEDVSFRLRSDSDVGILATDGGRVSLRGAIRLNENLHDEAEEESFCGMLATDHGVIEFDEHDGSSLELGNGSLAARHYGRIRLGCETARITCWTQSNDLSIGDSGRIDLADTTTTLCAKRRDNTPIGLEDDGHVLGEGAHLRLIGPNDSAIALQKASTLTCNDIELVGEFGYTIWARSGSLFVGRFLGDVTKLEARTGASIHVEKLGGTVKGEVSVASGGLVSLPDRVVR